MRQKVRQLLNEHGAVLVRQRKHEIWRLPNGKNFVRSKTPSDTHSDNNNYADLKRLLDLPLEEKEKGIRRERRTKQKRREAPQYTKSINNSLAQKLSLTGLTEDALRDENEFLAEQNQLLLEELNEKCWFCRLREWLRSLSSRISDDGKD